MPLSAKPNLTTSRSEKLRVAARLVVGLLFVKVLLAILYEYRWYFPANFDSSAFLIGRRETFNGLYRAAFYSHVLSGPLALILGSFLMLTGGRSRFARLHRWAGRTQTLIVLAIVVPSGLIMAGQATAGPIAAYAFASLSMATAVTAITAVYFAVSNQLVAHRIWASRCFVLLCSPLLLRLLSGVLIVLQLESDWFYRLNAWISWLVPLAVFEAYVFFMAPLHRRESADGPRVFPAKRIFNE